MRPIRILAGLTLAAALPVAAHTFGLVPGAAPPACLTIGNTTYRLAGGGADVAVRIDPVAAAPGLRITLAETPEEADFVLVDDGAAPNCRTATNVKEVSIAAGTAADLTVRLDRRGRSRRLSHLCALALDHPRDGSSAVCRSPSAATKTGWPPRRSIELIEPR